MTPFQAEDWVLPAPEGVPMVTLDLEAPRMNFWVCSATAPDALGVLALSGCPDPNSICPPGNMLDIQTLRPHPRNADEEFSFQQDSQVIYR